MPIFSPEERLEGLGLEERLRGLSHEELRQLEQFLKTQLESPENVAGLLQILSPELASRLDFSRLQDQNTSFVLDSLRKQESDLLFLVPFKGIAGETEREILIYILIEHQSTPVLSMGFRILFYMTLIWDRQRQEWQRAGLLESEWRFRPIVPILFYTGDRAWDTPLSVTALMDLPQELERFVPSHETPPIKKNESI